MGRVQQLTSFRQTLPTAKPTGQGYPVVRRCLSQNIANVVYQLVRLLFQLFYFLIGQARWPLVR